MLHHWKLCISQPMRLSMCLSVLLARLWGLFRYGMELHHQDPVERKPEDCLLGWKLGLFLWLKWYCLDSIQECNFWHKPLYRINFLAEHRWVWISELSSGVFLHGWPWSTFSHVMIPSRFLTATLCKSDYTWSEKVKSHCFTSGH